MKRAVFVSVLAVACAVGTISAAPVARLYVTRIGNSSSHGIDTYLVARGGFLPRHDEDLREPLVLRQGSHPSTHLAMAPHSSTPAWNIPWMEEPGRLQSMGSLRVRHD